MPPATTSSASPSATVLAPRMTAWRPEPQTLLTVVAGTVFGMPGVDGGLAGGRLADARPTSTLPMKTSSTSSGASFARREGRP